MASTVHFALGAAILSACGSGGAAPRSGTGGAASVPATGGAGGAAAGTTSTVLPVLWIDVNGQTISDSSKIVGTLRVIEEHDGTLTEIASRPHTLEAPIGIEYRGQWSLQFPKKGYSFELRDAAGEDFARPFLGMPEDSDWVLRAAYYDHTLMRDALGFWLFREIWGRYASRFRFVEVYLDGNYEGVYLACEKIKRARDRVDLPTVARDAASGDLTGGYLVHIESNSGTEGFATRSGRVWEYGYPSAEKIWPEQHAYLTNFFDRFEQAMAADNFSDPTGGYARWLDVPTAIDFALFQELARNTDGYTKSSYYQKVPDSGGGKILTAPIWDNDLSFGNFSNGTHTPEEWLYEFDWNRPVPWWERLWGDVVFRSAASCRWQALRKDQLKIAAIHTKLDEFAAILAQAQPRENARWRLIGHKESRSGYVGATWMEDITYLKSWLEKRIAWLDKELGAACKP